MPRSLEDLIAHADDYADRFEAYEPREHDRDKEPPVLALRRAAYRKILIERELAESVHTARKKGVPWREIGEAIGTTGEAARQRYGDKVA